MHEYSLVQALLQQVERQARAYRATAVHRLGVEPARRERPAEPAVWWQRPDGRPIGAPAPSRGG
ncbi:MAG TPA: hypothetical protein VM599_03750 [Thermoanaerobaculia bacterium]|nr:hypothetical protein [Thermoanaerobaculia bacterium]